MAQAAPFLPYALDNGAWSAFKNERQFDKAAFRDLVSKASLQYQQPLWIAVPDVVMDPRATIETWHEWAPWLLKYKFPLAFVVQDGHQPKDVPDGAEIVFVGGSVEWKLATLGMWCSSFQRVHVGRVNTPARLWACHEAGAESVDGSGWYHREQLAQLAGYLEQSTRGKTQLALPAMLSDQG